MLYINDTQAATKIYNDLESEGMLTTSFVSHDWYNAGQGVRVGSIDAKTMYVGQVTFVAEFKGRTSEYDPSLNVYEAVRSVADSFGTVSAFEQNNNAQYPLWQFRCEFYKVTAADRAIAAAGDGMKLDGVPVSTRRCRCANIQLTLLPGLDHLCQPVRATHLRQHIQEASRAQRCASSRRPRWRQGRYEPNWPHCLVHKPRWCRSPSATTTSSRQRRACCNGDRPSLEPQRDCGL